MSCTWTELEPETLTLMQINHLVASVAHLSAYSGKKSTGSQSVALDSI